MINIHEGSLKVGSTLDTMYFVPDSNDWFLMQFYDEYDLYNPHLLRWQAKNNNGPMNLTLSNLKVGYTFTKMTCYLIKFKWNGCKFYNRLNYIYDIVKIYAIGKLIT